MSRKYRSAKNCMISPWLSARLDCREGRFIQIGNSLLLSHKDKESDEEANAFLLLKSSAKILYLCMALEAKGRREFEFPLKSAKKYGLSESTFRRGVSELIEKGFIKRQSGKNVRLPNLYSFSLEWKKAS